MVTATLGAASCGLRGSDASEGHRAHAEIAGRLTPTQAGRAAMMLYENFLAGGASVSVAVTYSSALTVAMTGEVDWRNHRGRLTVKTVDAHDGRVVSQRVVFTRDTVFVQPLHDASSAASARTRWTRRAPDQSGHPLDRVIALLAGLAAVRPDNPLLVRQGALRAGPPTRVAGARVDLFTDAGKGVRYWVDRRTGKLLRLSGTLPGFTGPCVIDLTRHHRVSVALPSV